MLNDGTFVVMNGDTLVDIDLTALVKWHREKKAEATMLLRRKPTGSDYTGIQLDTEERVIAVGSDNSASLMFAGVWVLEPSVLGRLTAGKPAGLETELLPPLTKEGSLFGYVEDVPWFDIGTPRRYLRACLHMARHGLFRQFWRAQAIQPPGCSSPDTVVVAGPDTYVNSGACFYGDAVLGSGCRVHGEATIQGSVFLDGVTVGKGTVVRNSVVAEGVSLAAGRLIEGKLIMKAGESSSVHFRSREMVDGYIVAEIKH
jgi:mannose-1-phosphate guanylyltransferase